MDWLKFLSILPIFLTLTVLSGNWQHFMYFLCVQILKAEHNSFMGQFSRSVMDWHGLAEVSVYSANISDTYSPLRELAAFHVLLVCPNPESGNTTASWASFQEV